MGARPLHDSQKGESPKQFGLDEYEPIKPGESFIRDWNTFWAEKRDTHIQAIDVGSADHPDYVEVTVAEPRETYWDAEVRDSRTLLMLRADYKALADGAVVAAVPRNSDYTEIQR